MLNNCRQLFGHTSKPCILRCVQIKKAAMINQHLVNQSPSSCAWELSHQICFVVTHLRLFQYKKKKKKRSLHPPTSKNNLETTLIMYLAGPC